MATSAHPVHPLVGKTAGSAELHEEAANYLPGGVTANIKYFDPYPIAMESANGARMRDVDGNQYIDYNLCYGALMLGHGDPRVKKAVLEQMNRMGTTVLGTPHRLEVDMARTLVGLYPGIDTVRFTNSGLEATLLAIRLAMAWTGRPKLAKFEGHYHGGYDQVLISVNPDRRSADQLPSAHPDSMGIPDYYLENTVVLPFNDLDGTEEILRRHGHELAAVIIEPVQGGFIPPKMEFLKGLRELTRACGALLIFDEVKTGFRVGLSGAQGRYGVIPDLTALGKVLGGGFPVGAVGGRKEIMDICAPPPRAADILSIGSQRKGRAASDTLFHSGTYNGHPTVLAAGMATIEALRRPGVYAEVEKATGALRAGMEEILRRNGIPGQTVGVGSIFNLVLGEGPVSQVQDILRSELTLRRRIDYALLDQGIYVKPLNRFSLSTAHTPDVIEETLDRFERGVKLTIKGR
ncbi:glutamate-1-semialdehyde 2,1-aminomutase [Planifilum fimeticola]|uniref:Glutamate-1-semialdehyde 2,1-aminomutase n=1 Tax=Planifilum fimeticola TaxID=201975 RepID=A0A2T0LFK7_9BACL|nr:aspartate aminotransferase family protein [Planifilum fimeticola]PRX41007.1 glutamate-1-semialdehyde 2,1-aminomutase [Planifilum fimeticola]